VLRKGSRSCFTSDSRRVNLVTNPVINHEWGKDREVKSLSWTISKTINVYPSGAPEWVCTFLIPCCDVKQNRRGNQEWTFQRNWPHWEHKTQDGDKTQKHNRKTFGSSLFPFVLSGVHVLFMLFVFIYVGWCPMWFPCQMMLLSFNFISNKTGFTSRSRTAYPSSFWSTYVHPGFYWGSCSVK